MEGVLRAAKSIVHEVGVRVWQRVGVILQNKRFRVDTEQLAWIKPRLSPCRGPDRARSRIIPTRRWSASISDRDQGAETAIKLPKTVTVSTRKCFPMKIFQMAGNLNQILAADVRRFRRDRSPLLSFRVFTLTPVQDGFCLNNKNSNNTRQTEAPGSKDRFKLDKSRANIFSSALGERHLEDVLPRETFRFKCNPGERNTLEQVYQNWKLSPIELPRIRLLRILLEK